jgi:hypothetical protein
MAPHRAKVAGSDCADLIPGAGFEMVISLDAWQRFVACGIVGWELAGPLEAKVERANVVVRPHVSITRLDEVRSNVDWLRAPTCDECRMGVRKRLGPIVFDATTLDGSDIFVPSGAYGLKIVTERFHACVHDNALNGFRMIGIDEYRE